MSSINELERAIRDVNLGDIIEECVITFEDDEAVIQAMDLTSSLYVETTASAEFEDGQIGIGSLALFGKYLGFLKGSEVDIQQKENRLIVKPDTGTIVKYLLAEVDLIPSFNEEWGNDILTKELENYGKSMKLQKSSVDSCLKYFGLFTPNSMYFEVDKKGLVTLHGGKETDHIFIVDLGKIKGVDPCVVKVYGKHLTPVLSAIDYSSHPKLYLKEDEAVIIATDISSWMLQPISNE